MDEEAASPADDRAEAEWWRFRARLAASLWTAFAESGMTVMAAAAASDVKERRIYQMLSGEDCGADTGDLFRLFHTLGFRVRLHLQEAIDD